METFSANSNEKPDLKLVVDNTKFKFENDQGAQLIASESEHTTRNELRELARTGNRNIRSNVALHSKTSPDVLSALSEDEDAYVSGKCCFK